MPNDERRDIAKRQEQQPQRKAENSIQLGRKGELDLSGLTEEQKRNLKQKHAEYMIDVERKAAELVVDAQALGATLRTMGDETKNVAESGGSVTMQHVSESSIGKTEVMMGTSEEARKGKLSKTVTGANDYTLIYVIIMAFVVLALAYFIFR